MGQPTELRVWSEDLPENIQYEMCEDDDQHTINFMRDGITLTVGCGHTTWHDGSPSLWATVYGITVEETRYNGIKLRNLLKAVALHYKKHDYDFAVSSADTPWQDFHITLSGIPVREECTGIIVDKRKQALCALA